MVTTRQIKRVDTIKVAGSNYGPVSIHRGNAAKVMVHANKSNDIKTKVTGKQLTVSGKSSTSFMNFDDHRGTTVEITVPKNTQIKSIDHGGNTNVNVADLTVQTLRSTGNGDLNLANVKVLNTLNVPDRNYGDTTMNNVTFDKGLNINAAGDVTIRNSRFVKADSRIRSTDGDVNLSNNRWRNLTITSSNGDLNLEDQIVKTTLTAETADGDLTARIMPHAGMGIHASSLMAIPRFTVRRSAIMVRLKPLDNSSS
ncbi:DUF4097 family beta strand repeat-containing protein [Secundilactobacillus silagei]|uniref:DUF4097 family beta strand repeat-containing protein n=1 Tax=Secundilactobacillus silagei TaxID=1293415 RepID=UPI0006CF3E10|nr:DUF4097 family beta strand repeat-containing protein [Secundilactobacillus silagei]